jgi:hypothetical protein
MLIPKELGNRAIVDEAAIAKSIACTPPARRDPNFIDREFRTPRRGNPITWRDLL